MQFQADVLHIPVDRPKERESTALGAALLCACALGLADEKAASELRAGTALLAFLRGRALQRALFGLFTGGQTFAPLNFARLHSTMRDII